MTAPLQAAGKIELQELTIISGSGVYMSLLSNLVEFNLFEDIYSGGMYGNVVVSDSIGLVHKLTMVGEEYLNVKFDTPGFDIPINKSFRCTGVENRTFTRDTTTESYIIHFVSPEVYLDHYMPVQAAFSGPVEDIVPEIFGKYLAHPRRLEIQDGQLIDSEDITDLSIFTECKNIVKFVSPTWSPMKCLSWLASKSISSDPTLPAANFLFFESNKRFYWGSIESMIKEQRDSQNIIGIYVYAPGNVKQTSQKVDSITVNNLTYSNPDIFRDFFSIHELTVLNNVDVLHNIQTGYSSSVHHELDIGTRKYTETVYDHATQYPFYNHTSANAHGFFADDAIRVPYAHQIVSFKHPGLYTGYKNNLNEQAKTVMPIRNSLLCELNQIKMKIEVHGRTDIEVGSMLYLIYPKSGEKTESDMVKSISDTYFSGLYIITAIHHRITLENHSMTMEIVKDSFGDINDGTAGG